MQDESRRGVHVKINRKQVCETALVERILTLDIAPGTMLDEAALSEEYALSRTPLREVFQRLAGTGYLTLEENRGAKVSSMDLSDMRTFFQSAPMIYAAIARLAAENGTASQLTVLKAKQEGFRAACAAGDANGMVMANHAFHRQLGDMAGNPYLLPSLHRLLIDHTRMGQMFFRPKTTAETTNIRVACDQHDAMIAAIEAREPARIVELTLAHWTLSRERIERYVRPDPLPFDLDQTKGASRAV